MEASRKSVTISCHCGAARQTLAPRANHDVFSGVSFCHCETCRHMTGLLCVSYAPISSHPAPSVVGLESYSTSPASTRYFCSTCGCHVFRARQPSPSAPPEEWSWEVATGIIIYAPDSKLPEKWHHLHVNDTKDGGLALWLPNSPPISTPPTSPTSPSQYSNDILPASCECKSVSLQITPPSSDPLVNPDSPYPDLLLPYISTPSDVVSNPSHEKWYLRPGTLPLTTHETADGKSKSNATRVRYLAGTCACPSCRLTSGFEIQTWAFVPRRNILISSSPESEHQLLDFAQLPDGVSLRQYESSSGRMREFCARCGATVFWHDRFRPDLIDVSAGLFRAGAGARAESWLDWWGGRVSFSEEAGKGREGGAKVWGEGVIAELDGRFRARQQQ
ncbi:Mss4-like protein [Achaetomium macrosporum]|uniref:Mss4-like protein n=1 Tax=Achaetomium macrosporum TaxID=79813 RepID=A0AAN7CCK7_9PEZI|nr:Mss4-like protein [Achaetomium macrosporum]